METKLLLKLASIVGIPAYILGYVLNIGTWKGDLVLGIGGIYLIIFTVYFTIQKFDEMKLRRMRMKEEKRRYDYEEMIRQLYGAKDTDRNFN